MLRKMPWIKEHVETSAGVVSFGDQMATGHGLNPLQRQASGTDTLEQAWDATHHSDDPEGAESSLWLKAATATAGLG